MSGLDTTLVRVPCKIHPTELLGRGVYDRKDRGRAARGTIPASLFALREDEKGISVDRLTHAPEEEAIAIAHKRAAAMEPIGKRSFYGWAALSAERAALCERKVKASPLKDGSNDYHAEIICLQPFFNDEGIEIDHAEHLSSLACWLPLKNP